MTPSDRDGFEALEADSEHLAQSSVRRSVQSAMARLSNSERKVARALLAAYPGAGLTTVAELAEAAGVSPPTVIRFTARLGYDGFPQFQKALVHEINEGMGSPLAQYGEARRAEGEGVLDHALRTFTSTLQQSFADLSTWDFHRVVRGLCDESRDVQIVGGRFSRLLGDYLASHLYLLRPRVELITGRELQRLSALTDAGASTLGVVYDYRRYDEDVRQYAEEMKAQGGTVMLLTDNWLSPIAKTADVVLTSRVEAPSPFDSLVPAMALTEALIAAVTEGLGERGRQRIERVEALDARLRTADPPTITARSVSHTEDNRR